jgi:hypothetical protein
MNKMKHTTILILCLIFLSNCDNFEREFYKKIDEVEKKAIENGFAYFDLSTITDFEWDSVLFIQGNKNIWIEYKEQIEEILHGRESDIHWEKRRFKGEVDTSFRWHTTDLCPGRDRFFFLTPDKKIVEKEIKHKQNGRFYFTYCDKHDSLRTNWLHHFWLSKQEANFSVIRIERKLENDTVANVWAIFETNCVDENKSNK